MLSNSIPAGQSANGKTAIRQLVVMANGEVRIPPMSSEVAHGHRAPDEHVKIVMPANKNWLLLEVEVQLDEGASPGAETRLPS